MTRSRSGRRGFLQTVLGGVTAGVAGCIERRRTATPRDGAATSIRSGPPRSEGLPVGLDHVATVSDWPLGLAVPPSGGHPRYVAVRPGVVRVLDADGLREEPLVDLGDAVRTGPEQGLLGLALHPDFAENRRLFVRYSAPRRPGTPEDYDHTEVLAEFRVSEDGLRADPDTERTVLEVPQPQATHNAGDVAFGPDGYLYVPFGDGGGSGDAGRGHAGDWYDALPGGNGQNVSANVLGGILRIDVDAGSDDRPYGIPSENPLVGEPGREEYFAWGFRNPWRMGFNDGELLVGDVGGRNYEEVNLVVAGGNYGWNVREGRHCRRGDACPTHTPEDVRGGEPLRDPVVAYPNASRSDSPVSGVAVVCGYRYRGSAIPGLADSFVFADWRARGRLFAATPRYDGRWPTEVVPVAASDRDELRLVFAVERDRAGELYVLAAPGPGTGRVYRLVAGG